MKYFFPRTQRLCNPVFYNWFGLKQWLCAIANSFIFEVSNSQWNKTNYMRLIKASFLAGDDFSKSMLQYSAESYQKEIYEALGYKDDIKNMHRSEETDLTLRVD